MDIHAKRNRSELVIDVTAHEEGVVVRAALDGEPLPARGFHGPRKRESDLLAETIDAAGSDPIAAEVLAMAAKLVSG